MKSSRRLHLRRAAILLSLLALPFAQAQDPFDCHVSLEGGKRKYDLTKLAGDKYVKHERVTPPSQFVDELRFNLCADLQKVDGVSDEDQCAPGTRACFTMNNVKGPNTDRIVAVIPLAVSKALNPDVTAIPSPGKGVNVIFHGDSYPTTDPIPQSFNISILCDTADSVPTIEAYNGKEMIVQWKAQAGCEFAGDEPPASDGDDKSEDGGKPEERVGSGIGWFFLLLLIAFLAYFALGSYYNYSTYGATGLDMLPHRDFWREVPYILRDIISHLCSAIRPSRSGYIAV